MTKYSKDEPFIIGCDFDNTITSKDGGMDFPPPQKGFLKFYNFIHNYNKKNEDHVYIVIHTARNLDSSENWNYIKDYLSKYNLNEIFLPKRDGLSMKNNLNTRVNFAVPFSYNSKIPCSCYIDDINIGVPTLKNGELNWKKIEKLVVKQIKQLKKQWKEYVRLKQKLAITLK